MGGFAANAALEQPALLLVRRCPNESRGQSGGGGVRCPREPHCGVGVRDGALGTAGRERWMEEEEEEEELSPGFPRRREMSSKRC